MPTPNADDPLQTPAHDPAPVPEPPPDAVTTDARLAPKMGNAFSALAGKKLLEAKDDAIPKAGKALSSLP
jgi:hypothetical protein